MSDDTVKEATAMWNQLCDIVRADVKKIDEYRPHVVVRGRNVHVLPIVLLEKLVTGTTSIYDIEEHEDLIEAIAREWAEFVLRGSEDDKPGGAA